MATQYNWQISALNCIPQVGDMTDYVLTSHWRCTGDDGEGHTGQVYSTVSFAVDPEKPNYRVDSASTGRRAGGSGLYEH